MKIGMSKLEAKRRSKSEEFTWESLVEIMRKAHKAADASWEKPSRVNPGLSKAVIFNILWKSVSTLQGQVHPSDSHVAANILREFGISNLKPRQKVSIQTHHEKLVEI